MANTPVVNHYYISEESQVPVPLFFTPNVSMEALALSQSKDTSSHRGKRGRELMRHDYRVNGIAVRTAGPTAADKSIHDDARVVNPYEKSHQGPVRPISSEEERSHLDESIDYYRRAKFPRKEPLKLLEVGGAFAENNATTVHAELRLIREQHDQLSKLVEETRVELQRSREALERSEESARRCVQELRVEVAQLKKHVELMDGRQSSLEGTLGSFKGMQTLVDTVRGDVAALRTEVSQKSTAIALLEKSIDDVKRQALASATAREVPSFTCLPINPATTAGAVKATPATEALGTPANAFAFGGGPTTLAAAAGTGFASAAKADETSSGPAVKNKNPFSFGGSTTGVPPATASGFGAPSVPVATPAAVSTLMPKNPFSSASVTTVNASGSSNAMASTELTKGGTTTTNVTATAAPAAPSSNFGNAPASPFSAMPAEEGNVSTAKTGFGFLVESAKPPATSQEAVATAVSAAIPNRFSTPSGVGGFTAPPSASTATAFSPFDSAGASSTAPSNPFGAPPPKGTTSVSFRESLQSVQDVSAAPFGVPGEASFAKPLTSRVIFNTGEEPAADKEPRVFHEKKRANRRY
ncbi:hypothetical protein TraAM80_03132 [Trypanosoma rangeli]|uniref:Nucleoporin n=1 Tax=Trypanosoma rangeli TaxID=5698 RepID=A0A3R7NKK4_TRYRA|nr:uncharacterized protein TraAM80_03132 [Trypanosoma rangeli]RNF07874.1 hypothetical protein TraAM80_03132 [Trypanosoma rangeli]|eukprot:RNF07874.1 hypothetical protein TraAM80_03132 [Trypanosoma rangeli]